MTAEPDDLVVVESAVEDVQLFPELRHELEALHARNPTVPKGRLALEVGGRLFVLGEDGIVREFVDPALFLDPGLTGPPRRAEQTLWLFLGDRRQELIGDLEEEYRTIILPKFGVRFARTWYWKQVLSSLWPIACSRVRSALKLAALLRAVDWVRRIGL
jgi:hypothetical protein